MNVIADIFSLIVRAFLMLFALFFIMGFMALAIVFITIAWVWGAITGRPNSANVWWQRMDKTRSNVWQTSRGAGARHTNRQAKEELDIIDVTDVTDIEDKPPPRS